MSLPTDFKPDPDLDLVLEREVDVPPHLVWAAWTQPEHVKQWFTPAPWTTPECEIDLRPGGRFRTLQRSPDGDEQENNCCILEVVENERLVWTTVLGERFRPNVTDDLTHDLVFTAIIALEPTATGTRYTAVAMHPAPALAARHAELGFHDGWGAVLDQLVAYMKSR